MTCVRYERNFTVMDKNGLKNVNEYYDKYEDMKCGENQCPNPKSSYGS
jgi:hypothetical protein